MALYVIGDLHLSLGAPEKPMDIFNGWENYIEFLRENWCAVSEDTVVLAGDLSWAMGLEASRADFEFINSLPGTKIILKGNHDYWWTTKAKLDGFFAASGFNTLNILHNNCYAYGEYGICGTRGWVNMPDEPADAKVIAREAQRLEVSIKAALAQRLKPIVFLHYPPLFGGSCNYEMLDVLYKYKIKECYYGHIHGSGHKNAVIGERDGVNYHLISSDFLQFYLEKVL